MANTALNRTTAALLTNKSGGDLAYGAVVVLDNTNAKGFTTTTTGALSTRGIGVIIEPNGIANNATGLVATAGWCPKVTLNTAATVGQFIKTHTVAGQATPHSSPQVEGDFGYALQASATPECILFGSANQAGGGSGDVVGPGSATDNAIVRFDSTTGKLVQDSAITMSDTGALTFPDNIRQTFNPGADAAGINVGSIAGDPGTPSNGDLWYDSTANELTARINGANVSLGASSSGDTYVVASADESVSSNTTPQNDDALVFAADASAVYVVEVHACFTSSTDSTVDVNMSWSIPASATITWMVECYPATATSIDTARNYTRYQATTTTGGGVITTATIDASPVHIWAIVRTAGTSGNVNFQFAQGTSSGTAVVRKADSFLKYRKTS